MKQESKSEFWITEDGMPVGGVSQSTGLLISWQNGPLGRGDERREPNGAFVETVIQTAINRLMFYQESRFECEDNAAALDCLKGALVALERRTARREDEGTEGTHEI